MSDLDIDGDENTEKKINEELEQVWKNDNYPIDNNYDAEYNFFAECGMTKTAYIVGYNREGDITFSKETNKKKIAGFGWMAMFQKKIREVSALRLTGETLSVFLNMVGRMDYDNIINASREEIGKELNMRPQNVSRAIRKLLEEDIITEGPRAGLCKTYILNPNVGIKGKQKRNKLIDYKEAKAARIATKAKKSSTTDKTKE